MRREILRSVGNCKGPVVR